METHNRDMWPAPPTVARFAAIECLVENPAVNTPFLEHENAAGSLKRRYHFLGRTAIALIALGSIYTVAEALFDFKFAGALCLGVAATVIVAVGIAIQIYVIAADLKVRWLLDRFAAERLRAIKFEAYPLAELAANAADLKSRVDQFYTAEADKLNNQLNPRKATLDTFSPKQTLEAMVASVSRTAGSLSAPVNPQLAMAARDAYGELRTAYQKAFAADQLNGLEEGRRVNDTSADLLYLAGAVSVLAALFAKITLPPHISTWFDFVAIVTFIAGMSKAVLDNASLHEESRTRFERYARDLEEAEATCKNDTSLFDIVPKIELVVLGELDAFCRAASKISYRL